MRDGGRLFTLERMALRVHLLGPPSIERDGEPVQLSGRKPWALLTYLLLEERPTRREIAARLIPEANDPLAALRWLLHQVRRALEPEVTIDEREGRLSAAVGEGVSVDLLRLLAVPEDVDEIEDIVSGELLEGMEFDDAPAFEMWLALQRTRAHDAIAEALWWVTNRVASEDPDRALRLVERGLVFDPFCETTNELLIDLLVQTGNDPVARQRLQVIERRFLDELGVPPSDTVRRPLERPRTPASVPAASSARGLLESARARLTAGELDRAVETARRGADVALALGDPALELSSLLLLASTLIHAHRGRDQEAKGLLSRAVQLAADLGDLATLADVEREMGFVFAMEPGYGLAEAVLARSVAHADAVGDDVRAAKAETYFGMCASDRCDFVVAEQVLARAIERLAGADELGWQGCAEGMLARVVERTGDPARAAAMADIGTDHVRRGGWTAVLPWPMLIRAECALDMRDREGATDRFAEALTLGSEIGDPCWEALALRGLGLLRTTDDIDAATRLLEEGLRCCRRFTDVYPWARAMILADLVELERGTDVRHIDEALDLAMGGPIPDVAERLVPYLDLGVSQQEAIEASTQTPAQTAAP
jgi:DNA-binding SARP family transcriptional activator